MSGPAEPSRSGRSGLRSVGLPTLDQQDDEELIRRVARGDTSAFEVVYQLSLIHISEPTRPY